MHPEVENDDRLLSDPEVKQVLLDQLAWIDKLCRENNIEYTLAAGSLLGAIRHRGFIPWDDDIDIELTRPNYEKLLSVLVNELPNDSYSLSDYRVKDTVVPFAKLVDNSTIGVSKLDVARDDDGVFLDIFPVDSLPEGKADRQRFIRKINLIGAKLRASYPGGLGYAASGSTSGFLVRLITLLPFHLAYSGKTGKLSRRLDQFKQTYNDSQTTLCRNLFNFRKYPDTNFPTNIYTEYEDVAFEDLTVRKVVDHDQYLKIMYHEYMRLPPESSRRNHGYRKYYWRSSPKSINTSK